MKSYLITDPLYYTSNTKTFTTKLLYAIKNKSVDFICLRDKETANYKELAMSFKKVSDTSNIKAFLHTDYFLAYELGFYGVHLTSKQFSDIKTAKKLGLHVVVSTHTLSEALHVEKLGADFITFSPIFFTPNKGEPKGLEKLKEINDKININCFALGGIVEDEQIQACKDTGIFGFASIRYFIK